MSGWRLRGCPRCRGDQENVLAVAMIGQREGWRCLQCGLEIEEAGLARREVRDHAGVCEECGQGVRVRHTFWHPDKGRLVWVCPPCEGLLHERRSKLEWERLQRVKVEAGVW